jgi:Allene oxide cyclase barrel like domain
MQLKFVLFVLPAALAVLVVLSSPASALTKPQTFSLLSVESGAESQIGGFGFQREPVPGDRFAFTDQLFKWAGAKRGAHLGRVAGLCTFTRVTPPTFGAHCAASFLLPAGQIYVGGFVSFPDGPLDFDVPVLGGTGRYSNARGFVHIRDLGNGESGKSNNEFHLLP